MTGRIVIDDLRPRAPHAGFPAKAVVGEAVTVRVVMFRDGHDILAGEVALQAAGAAEPEVVVPLEALGNDEWEATVVPSGIGRHSLVARGWTDRGASWAHKVEVKLEAGQEIDVEIAEGILLVEAARAAGRRGARPVGKAAAGPRGARPVGKAAAGPVQEALDRALGALRDSSLDAPARVAPAMSPPVTAALRNPVLAADRTEGPPQPLWVDRPRALVGAWYELFPRSYGGFDGVVARLPAIAAMGFDVVYLPPIHPIGTSHRKGRNNSLVAADGDPGSPWAIGGPGGGHTAILPDLGTIESFRRLVAETRNQGMELALDYALQCSPDHPWVRDHPEWFHHRPDGSIAYAENPPKKYQDIYPINFWPAEDADRVALWVACLDILRYWIGEGIRIFRVDNPHTKPIAFWEWLIPTLLDEHPDVILLAEAFTRPHVMAKLAEVGFSQSYTYFTWRTAQHGEEGLWAYMEELAHGPNADIMRPNFWPNTPDILAGPLRGGPPAAFALRAVLAATLTPSYGIYSGYELYENQPASPTNEEYLDSEKYQLRPRDFSQPGSLAPLLTALNRARRSHPALQRLRHIQFHPSDNPQVVAYSKRSDDGADAVLTVVTLDPYVTQESVIHLDLDLLRLPADRPFLVRDELSGEGFIWTGPAVYVRLEPWWRVAHVIDLYPQGAPPVAGRLRR